jgi:hypothetical protein
MTTSASKSGTSVTKDLKQYPDRLELQPQEAYLFVIWSLGALLGLGALVGGVLLSDLLTAALGLFFLAGCGFGASGVTQKTIILRSAGPCQLVSRQFLVGKTTTRTLNRTDIKQINYLQAYYDDTSRWWTYMIQSSEVLIELNSGEQITALYRSRMFLDRASSMAPTKEARQISQYLQVPLNTVDFHDFRNGLKNFDKALKVGERPGKK